MKKIIFKQISGGRMGLFGVCPPCVSDENYPNFACDPCDMKVLPGGIKGWIGKRCSYEFTDITDPDEWAAAIANKDVFGRVNGARITGNSDAADAQTVTRGSCESVEVSKYVRTVQTVDVENDTNLSINDIYAFLRSQYQKYDFAFITCDNHLIGFFSGASVNASPVIPATNSEDRNWTATFTFNEDIDAFPEYDLPFLDGLQLWTCWITAIQVTGQGGITTVANGESLQMVATITPTNATNPAVVWSVVNGTGSATINSSTGLLTATGVGIVTVVATAVDGPVFGSKDISIT